MYVFRYLSIYHYLPIYRFYLYRYMTQVLGTVEVTLVHMIIGIKAHTLGSEAPTIMVPAG